MDILTDFPHPSAQKPPETVSEVETLQNFPGHSTWMEKHTIVFAPPPLTLELSRLSPLDENPK